MSSRSVSNISCIKNVIFKLYSRIVCLMYLLQNTSVSRWQLYPWLPQIHVFGKMPEKWLFCYKCPEVVRHTKALTMYRQFPGLITKMKQKYKITGLTILVLFACVSSKTSLFHNTSMAPILFQFHLSII